jgi:chromosomal replication initiation ATPase DnaA
MEKIQRIEMSDSDHGLIGMGKISYTYRFGKGKHELLIHLHLLNQTIKYTGDEAKRIYHKTISDSDKSTINLLKRLASESCRIPLIRISEVSRKREVVFARGMVYWYLRQKMSLTLDACAKVFDQNHATAINGINLYLTEPKYLSDDQRAWKKTFSMKLLEHKLI